VITLPSEYWGEVIIAVAEAPADDWQDKARAAIECLARYKHPRAYVAIDALPRNPQGKIGRAAVRTLVLETWRLVDGQRPALAPR
jgi:acyl-CoA synthetase (AMP-forming)/AMP-acid ligase II